MNVYVFISREKNRPKLIFCENMFQGLLNICFIKCLHFILCFQRKQDKKLVKLYQPF